MVKIILVLALLQYIYNFIFGYRSNILSCGIFGQATDTPVNLDVNGVHILGIYNIERGKMSCGLSWDGDVQYGIGFDKLYTDFIVDRKIEPVKTPIMIGHTRQPSYGMAITEDNAHPFGFGTSKDGEGYEMIFCHNGTLKNHKELAKKYNIDLTEKITKISHGNHSYESTRDKIDSEILGEILYRTKKFHVLSEYIGAAALAWTWIDEPNKLYLWSGASKQTKGSKIPTETEERPVKVYAKNKNNMFFSSLGDPLSILGANKKDDLQIDYNTVYIITDGDFANAEKHKISRRNAGQSEEIVYAQQYGNYNRKTYNEFCDWDGYYDTKNFNKDTETPKQDNNTHTLTNLHDEKTIKPIVDYKSGVYFKSLRYWTNGSLLNGIFVYIKDYGFKQMGNDVLGTLNHLEKIKGLSFNYSLGIFNYGVPNDDYVPFKKDCKLIQFHYFIDGVLLKSSKDYNRAKILKDQLKLPAKHLDYTILSHISKHPLIDIDSTTKSPVVLLNGEKFTGNIAELGFEKVYYFKDGYLVKWVKRDDIIVNKTPLVIDLPQVVSENKIPFDKKSFNQAMEIIKNIEKETKSNDKLIELNDEEFINELILDTFERHSEEISETIIELSDWKDNKDVIVALDTLKLINHTLKGFVENPQKN